MNGIAVVFIPIVCGLLWIGIIAPAILRSLGVPMAFGLWRLDRLNRHLSKTQQVWALGVFSFGLGMFWYSTMFDYLEWKLLNGSFSYLDPSRITGNVVVCLLAGLLVGIFGARNRKDANTASNGS